MNLIELISLLEKAGKDVTSAQEVKTNVESLSFPYDKIIICTDEKKKFIDKACMWLQINGGNYIHEWSFLLDLIEDFKKAMEEE